MMSSAAARLSMRRISSPRACAWSIPAANRSVRICANCARRASIDLSRRADVLAAARSIADRHPEVQLLINNAGAHFPEHRLSTDKVEMHIAVKYLAVYGLTALLSGAWRRGRARVDNSASDTVNDTRQVKLLGRPRPAALDVTGITDLRQLSPAAGFVAFQAYATATLMTVTAGYHLADRLAADGVTVNSCTPAAGVRSGYYKWTTTRDVQVERNPFIPLADQVLPGRRRRAGLSPARGTARRSAP